MFTPRARVLVDPQPQHVHPGHAGPARRERLFVQDVLLDTAALPAKPWNIGLSAILEEDDGTISYWALAHGSGRPDFHHPDGFTLTDETA